MEKKDAELIEQARRTIWEGFKKESTGHDYWHIFRVWKTAKFLGEREKAQPFIVEISALLHDIADWKFHGGNLEAGPEQAEKWLRERRVDPVKINHIKEVIAGVSFKGAKVKEPKLSLEAQIVQDADRLDAIGAIGIARCFAYGGFKGNPLYEPEQKPHLHETAASYISSKGSSINHFYEKLLLLKDRLHTRSAREIAAGRHQMMEVFLKQFFAEWNEFT